MKSEQLQNEKLYFFKSYARYNNIWNLISNWGTMYGDKQMPKCLKLNEMNGTLCSHIHKGKRDLLMAI